MNLLTIKLKTKKNYSDKTIQSTLSKLRTLNGGNDFSNLDFLLNKEAMDEILVKYNDKSRQVVIYTIITALESNYIRLPSKVQPVLKKYKEDYEALKKDNMKNTNEKTEKMENNWINWSDVKEMWEEMNKMYKNEDNDYIDFNGDDDYIDFMLRFVIMSLFVLLPPRRNADYMNMYITNMAEKDYDKLDEDKNYINVHDQKFIFNKYKTSKTYGRQVIEIKTELTKIIINYFSSRLDKSIDLLQENKDTKLYPPTEGKPFLVFSDGRPLNQDNHITRILNKIFGKNIGASMLRNIYITNELPNDIKKRKEIAKMMGHSVSTQINNYTKE
jgi:hypothetical protein